MPVDPLPVILALAGLAAAALILVYLRRRPRTLSARQVHLEAVINSLPDAVLVLDSEWRVLAANQMALDLMGGDRAALIGRQPGHVLSDWPALMERCRDRESGLEELHCKGRDFEMRFAPLRGDGGPGRRIVTLRDVTDRKAAEARERDLRLLAEALRDTSSLINQSLELDDVLDHILDGLRRVVPHDAANVMLIEGGTARIVRHHGYSARGLDEYMGTLRFEVSRLPNLQQMVTSQRPLNIPDLADDPGWVRLPRLDWIRAFLGAPILLRGEVIGFLNLDSAEPGFFTQQHQEALESFAAQAAGAIANARLYQSMRETAQELAARNSELDAFSHTVAHDLRAPLHIVLGYLSLLNTDMAGELTPTVASLLKEVEAGAQRILRLLDGLLLLSQLRSSDQAATPLDVGPVLKEVTDQYHARLEERGIALIVEEPLPPAMGHAPWLEVVFANLLENAIKYIGGENRTPRIIFRGRRDGPTARFEVEDNGVGIALADQAHLFEAFTRFTSENVSGFGLGLSIVHRIVTKLGGEVGVHSRPGEGSTFWFTLPAADLPAERAGEE
ncbi:MAG: hypothetical protein Kow00124_23400 [Anaerolineae bacterium]